MSNIVRIARELTSPIGTPSLGDSRLFYNHPIKELKIFTPPMFGTVYMPNINYDSALVAYYKGSAYPQAGHDPLQNGIGILAFGLKDGQPINEFMYLALKLEIRRDDAVFGFREYSHLKDYTDNRNMANAIPLELKIEHSAEGFLDFLHAKIERSIAPSHTITPPLLSN